MNKYERAAQARDRGLLGNITDRLTSGGGSIPGSIGRGISDTFKAKVTGVKEKFDPLNIAKKMTGGVGVGILGRMMGRSSEDMSYFANKGEFGGLPGGAFTPMMNRSKSNLPGTAFYATVAEGSRSGLKKNDSLANVGAKLYNVMKVSHDIKKLQGQLDKNFSKERAAEDQRRHEEFIDAIEKSKKKAPEPKKTKKEVEKQVKKAETAPPAPAPKAEPYKAPTPSPAPAKAPAPATKAEPAKASVPAPAPPSGKAPYTAKPAGAPANKKTTAKPAGTEKPPASPRNEQAPPKTRTPPARTEPAPPRMEPAPPRTATREPVREAMKTAAKVGAVGVAISPAAALSIERETGKSANEAIKSVGQIVPNDPKAGVSSYGIFGINSGGSVQSFVKQNPQFELTAKPASKEFDAQWSKISKDRPQEMLDAQLMWYNNNVAKPLKTDLGKIIPKQFADDARILTYLLDRRVQYGKVMESQALAYASSAKTPEEYISRISEFDISHLQDAFKTYLSTHPNSIKGLKNRIKEREKYSLKIPSSSIINNPIVGEKLNGASVANADAKKQSKGGTTVITDNTNTTIASPSGKPMTLTNPTPQDRPAHQQ